MVVCVFLLCVQGGFGIMEEMCVNYVHYYPRTQLELCKSHVDPDYLQRYFSIMNRCLCLFRLFKYNMCAMAGD